jgi:hypothetical protein
VQPVRIDRQPAPLVGWEVPVVGRDYYQAPRRCLTSCEDAQSDERWRIAVRNIISIVERIFVLAVTEDCFPLLHGSQNQVGQRLRKYRREPVVSVSVSGFNIVGTVLA